MRPHSSLDRRPSEFAAKGVCELEAGASQPRLSRLRVRPAYWPYEVREEPAREHGPPGMAG